MTKTLVLYDGVCGLCDGFVQFLLRRDRNDALRFMPLQSDGAVAALARHECDASDLDTVYVIVRFGEPDEFVLQRSRAVFFAVSELGGAWQLVRGLALIPAFITDLGYRVVARLRYRLFGKRESCAVPTPQQRAKFLS